jgi:hypothetical protein
MTGAGSVGEHMTELPTDHDCYDAADHYDIPATTGRNSCIWYCTRCGATLQVGRQAHPDETDEDLMAAAGASWQ